MAREKGWPRADEQATSLTSRQKRSSRDHRASFSILHPKMLGTEVLQTSNLSGFWNIHLSIEIMSYYKDGT
jgi:hypothetical protein